MGSSIWTTFVDLTTIVWLILFFGGYLATEQAARDLCGTWTLCLLPVFVADLVVLARRESNLEAFFRKKWFDVLLVIPYFRVFRVFRAARMLKLLKFLKLIKAKKALNATRFYKKSKRTAQAVGRVNKRGCARASADHH